MINSVQLGSDHTNTPIFRFYLVKNCLLSTLCGGRGRLTGATGKYGELSYQYDAIGNRVSSSDNGLLTTYGYEADTNRLSSLTSESETINYDYDPVGNLLAKNEQSFTWSPDNRLLQVKNNTQTLGEYGYDARGLGKSWGRY